MPTKIAIVARPSRAIAAAIALLVLATGTPALAADPPAGQMTWALHFTPAPTLYEPAETPGLITPFLFLYALHDALVKPMPGKNMAPEPGRVVDRVARRARLRVRAAPRGEVPQRRGRHGRRRQVLVRALPGDLGKDAQGQGGGGRDAGSWARPVPAQAAVAGLHGLLRHAGDGCGVDRAPGSTSSKVGEDGFKKAPIGAGPYRVRLVHARYGAGARGLRRILAQDAERQAPGVQERAGRRHATGHAQERRGRHRLFHQRRARRGGAAHAGAHAAAHAVRVDALAELRRSVGCELAVARPAGAPGGHPRGRPAGR